MRHFNPIRNGMSGILSIRQPQQALVAVDLKAAEGLTIVQADATADLLVHTSVPAAERIGPWRKRGVRDTRDSVRVNHGFGDSGLCWSARL